MLASTWALCLSTSISTSDVYPFSAARWSGVMPSLLLAPTNARWDRSTSATCSWPLSAARCRAALPNYKRAIRFDTLFYMRSNTDGHKTTRSVAVGFDRHAMPPPVSNDKAQHFVSWIMMRQRWDVQKMWAYDLDLWPWRSPRFVGRTRLGTFSEHQVQFRSIAHTWSIPVSKYLETCCHNTGS